VTTARKRIGGAWRRQHRLPVIEVIGTLSCMNYQDEMRVRRVPGAAPVALPGPVMLMPT
jgi:hypothetical protein